MLTVKLTKTRLTDPQDEPTLADVISEFPTNGLSVTG